MPTIEHRVAETLGWIERLVVQGRLPGVAIAVDVHGDRLVRGFGHETVGGDRPVTAQTRFPIGCLSKMMLALQCVERHLQGRLDIHAPIRRHLPDLPPGICDVISVAHILSHSTGFAEPHDRDAFRSMTRERLAGAMDGAAAAFAPGQMWSYTQTGHSLVAEILARIDGRTTFEGYKADFLDSLGIGPADISSKAENLQRCASFHMYSRARQRYEPVRIAEIGAFFRPAIADIPLSVEELLTLGLALEGGSDIGISAEAIALARRPHVKLRPACTGPMSELIPDGYGYGFGLYGEYWAATGSYTSSSVAIRGCTQRGVVIALAMNAWAPGIRDSILSRLMAALGDYRRPAQEVSLPLPDEDYEGSYEGLMLNTGALTVVRTPRGLACHLRRGGSEAQVALTRGADGRYAIEGGALSEVFGFDACGADRFARVGFGLYRRVAN